MKTLKEIIDERFDPLTTKTYLSEHKLYKATAEVCALEYAKQEILRMQEVTQKTVDDAFRNRE